MQGKIEGVLSPIFRCKKASCTTKGEQTSLDFLWRRKKWFFLRLHLLPLIVVEKMGAISIDSADALNPIAPFNAILAYPLAGLATKWASFFTSKMQFPYCNYKLSIKNPYIYTKINSLLFFDA